MSSGGHTCTDKCCTKGACTEKNLITTNEVDTTPCAVTTEKPHHGDTCTSDDDFMPAKVKKQSCTDKKPVSSDSEDEINTNDKIASPLILGMLPESYTYRMLNVMHFKELNNFHCNFRIKLDTEDSARKWIAKYNEKTKETMVFECCKRLNGKRVIKKFFLRCQHKQRQTGKHTKSNKPLKSTHKSHNDKHTNCPAQLVLMLLPSKKHNGFCVDVTLNHIHNHAIDVADALRFRPMSENTKDKYYDLFRQGHSPASAHLEYETNLTYSDDPQMLADRNVNPKVSDVYNLFNKWRKCNLGVRSGEQLFTELERRVAVYNDSYREQGGNASIQRYCKASLKTSSDGKEEDQPLILAICTPLMSRVHQLISQSKELVFIDASSSFEDFNNPLFVISTSSAAGGLPLGIVITSGESADVIKKGMTALKKLFPISSFYGNTCPTNIIIDDSLAERDGLHQTWPSANIFLCTFHFLQSMWRWLLCNKNGIHKDDRQFLMNLVRKLVYAKKESDLDHAYQNSLSNGIAKRYPNFIKHIQDYWARRTEWAVCFRSGETMRGINTNNYAESGIRILKDVVFRRIKAYNLVQLFEFLTVTFEMYYERRLLAVAHNRMDRYISLRYKGLGAQKVNQDSIRKSTENDHVYLVRSTYHTGMEYEVNTEKWTCTCTVGRTGYPSGEPCKHQHSVANKYNLTAPTLLPYFNGEGRYLHAVIALGYAKAGDKSFYAGMTEEILPSIPQGHIPQETNDATMDIDSGHGNTDDGEENLDLMLSMLEEHNNLQHEVIALGNTFIEDVQERIKQVDIHYLSGLKKFFTTYLDMVTSTEPTTSATPKLASLLHTYFSQQTSLSQKVAGTRHMHVQPTAISRRREGISKGSKLAPNGRPPKRPLDKNCDDPTFQIKRGRADHVKRKQNLRQNELKNQANHHKHGRGH